MTPYRYFKDKDEILSGRSCAAPFRVSPTSSKKRWRKTARRRKKSDAVGRAYIRFALEEQACYSPDVRHFSGPRMAPLPALFAAERRARATMTDHVRLMIAEGYFQGDPELIGSVLWAGLHGVVTLYLAGAVADGGEFERMLDETMRALTAAYRLR